MKRNENDSNENSIMKNQTEVMIENDNMKSIMKIIIKPTN
jgi:hypothetical protein